MQIVQRKSKDAEEAAPVFASLMLVPINGWLDEDGEQVTSAVLAIEEAPPERRKESKLDAAKKMIKEAWFYAGAEDDENGNPNISRAALLRYLMEKMNLMEASAKQYAKPSNLDKPVGMLVNAQIIEAKTHGFTVICPVTASNWRLDRESR
jgi:hypothetical protein